MIDNQSPYLTMYFGIIIQIRGTKLCFFRFPNAFNYYIRIKKYFYGFEG